MLMNQTELKSIILELLVIPREHRLLNDFEGTLTHAIRSRFPEDQRPLPHYIMVAVWSLISQGLAYIDYSQKSVESWTLHLTDAGRAAAVDDSVNPDNESKYIKSLLSSVPQANEIVLQYAREALTTYNNRCHLASAVMLGVASEAAFLDMARSFGKWLPQEKERDAFVEVIESKHQNYIKKFQEFRKKIEKYGSQLPDEFADGMALSLTSVLDLLRIYRNDAGHPTGRKVTREDAFINLQMFVRYLQKLYSLKNYFEKEKAIINNQN